MEKVSDFKQSYQETKKTAPAEVYYKVLRDLFPGEKILEPVDMQGTLADRYGGDVVSLISDPESDNAYPVFVDNKVRAKERGQDVFFEAFHVFYRDNHFVPVDDTARQQIVGKKVFFLLAEASNKIPLAHRNLSEVFFAVNSVLSRNGEKFKVEPGWGFSKKLISDVILTTYPSGRVQAYKKSDVQKNIVQNFEEGLRNRNLQTLSPSFTKGRYGNSIFMTFNMAVDIQWLQSKNHTRILSFEPEHEHSKVIKYSFLKEDQKQKLDTLIALKLRNKGLFPREFDPVKNNLPKGGLDDLNNRI